jgi:hypothetical protein
MLVMLIDGVVVAATVARIAVRRNGGWRHDEVGLVGTRRRGFRWQVWPGSDAGMRHGWRIRMRMRRIYGLMRLMRRRRRRHRIGGMMWLILMMTVMWVRAGRRVRMKRRMVMRAGRGRT